MTARRADRGTPVSPQLRPPYPGRLLGLILWAFVLVVVAVDGTAGTWPQSFLIALALPAITLLLIGPRK